MGVRDVDKIKYTKAWLGLSHRDNDQGAWRVAPKRSQHKDTSKSTFKTILDRSIRRNSRSSHDTQDRPRSLNSSLTLSERGPPNRPASPITRCASAPLLTADRSSSPERRSHTHSRHIFFEGTNQANESLTLNDDPTSTDDEDKDQGEDDSNNDTTQRASADNVNASVVAETAPESPAYVSQRGSEVHSEIKSYTTDSGSVPTQIINLSEELSDDPDSTPARTVLEIQQALRDLYGSTYQQSDDVVGICSCDDSEIAEKMPTLSEFFAQLDLMSDMAEGKESYIVRESMAPYLTSPAAYNQALLQAGSTANDQTLLAKTHISAWILFCLVTSRVDGLNLIYVVCLGQRARTMNDDLFLLTDVAAMVQRYWFADQSNLPSEEKSQKQKVPRSGCRTGLRTAGNSTNSSKVQAVISGPKQGEKKQSLPADRSKPLDTTAQPSLSSESDSQAPANETQDSSTADDETRPTIARPELGPEAAPTLQSTSLEKDLSHQQEEAEKVVQDSSLEYLRGSTIDSRIQQDSSNTSRSAFEVRVDSPADAGQKISVASPLRSGEEQIACKCPTCGKSFLNAAELANHNYVWHQVVDHTRQSSPPPVEDGRQSSPPPPYYRRESPSPRNLSLAPEEVKPKIDRSLSLELAKRNFSPLGSDFRIPSAKEAPDFFVVGRVLAVLWHESSSPWSSVEVGTPKSQSPNLTASSYGEPVYSHIRRFLVIKARRGYCWALPVFTYSGKGASKKTMSEIERRQHAIIHDSTKAPERLSDELPFTKEAFPVEMEVGETLPAHSRLHFDKPQSIEWKVKVKNVGMVKGDRNIRNLVLYFRTESLRGEGEESIAEDEEGELTANENPEQDTSIQRRAVPQNPSTAWM